MKLISINDYIKLNFVGDDKPTSRTVRNWLEQNLIPGKKIGGKWWIDLSKEKTGNELVDRVLNL